MSEIERGRYAEILVQLPKVLVLPVFWLALLVFVVANALWMLVLATEPLSYAYPMQLGLVVLMNAILSVFFFSDRLTVAGIIGMLLILVGVCILRQATR